MDNLCINPHSDIWTSFDYSEVDEINKEVIENGSNYNRYDDRI